ncbi:hypothetical protein [Rathayibacter iranicus]|uniref:Uncharacterized protein n=1 Tax=Rathayibacter iranicus NCPPB 2253 = VKM Ac-1602 TaxID=1328868 RepID=A0ABX5L9N9_9MICO|nr:hypothetical protein B0H03_11315 [Rathayibacter iranicus NCPPB 2253 = VKM Ac-1602]
MIANGVEWARSLRPERRLPRIADAVLGAINAKHLGESSHIDKLRSTLIVETRTPDSLNPEGGQTEEDERP